MTDKDLNHEERLHRYCYSLVRNLNHWITQVIAAMRRRKEALSDTEITERAGVNNQYVQRHRDLRAYGSTSESLDRYFLQFATAARSGR